MEVSPLTIVAVVGVASLLIERVFYYKAAYKKKNNTPNNPSPPVDYHNHEGRLSSVETDIGNLKDSNEKDHGLIREDIRKLTNLFNRKIFGVLNNIKK